MNLNLTIQVKKFRKNTTGGGNCKCKGQEANASVTYLVATLRVQSTEFKWSGEGGLVRSSRGHFSRVKEFGDLENLWGFLIRE